MGVVGGGGIGGGGAGLTEIKANSASQQSWSWGLAELGNNTQIAVISYFKILDCSLFQTPYWFAHISAP